MENTTEHINEAQHVESKPKVTKPVPVVTDEFSAYNPRISRKLMEGLCGVSTNTLVNYERDGIIHPQRVRQGAQEVVTYGAADVQAVLKKRGESFVSAKNVAEVIAVWSQKGGVGKSAFIQHIASFLSLVGRVLVIDLDSQSDATSLFNLNVKYTDIVQADGDLEPTIAELMDWTLEDDAVTEYRKLTFEEVVKKISPTLHVIPADLDLGEINYSLNRLPLKDKFGSDGEVRPAILFMIKDVIESVKHDYDFILFDCPPNIEAVNVNALFAANRILIPLELEAKCLRTMRRNEDFLAKLQALHPGFNFEKILVVPNKFRRENIKIKALAALQDIYGERTDVQLSEAVFPNGAVIDRCSEAREPVFSIATRNGKEFKASVPQAREFTDLFWIVIHEILGKELTRLVFASEQVAEA